jgi:histidinol-phosphate phosphatase family protein
MNQAIFLDRDGVIIENNETYVRSWDDVNIYPQALEALRRLAESQYKVIVITNQSAIGRELLTIQDAREINQRIVRCVRSAGGRIDAVYMCPHAPWEHCECRKPKPGLILKAIKEFNIDPHKSILIGDAQSDLEAGLACSIKETYIVRTGRGNQQIRNLSPKLARESKIADCMQAAVEEILSQK